MPGQSYCSRLGYVPDGDGTASDTSTLTQNLLGHQIKLLTLLAVGTKCRPERAKGHQHATPRGASPHWIECQFATTVCRVRMASTSRMNGS
jgi:hypothetical protein